MDNLEYVKRLARLCSNVSNGKYDKLLEDDSCYDAMLRQHLELVSAARKPFVLFESKIRKLDDQKTEK